MIFTFVSLSYTTFHGHRVDQVTGQPFSQFIHSDDARICVSFLQSVMNVTSHKVSVEYRFSIEMVPGDGTPQLQYRFGIKTGDSLKVMALPKIL